MKLSDILSSFFSLAGFGYSVLHTFQSGRFYDVVIYGIIAIFLMFVSILLCYNIFARLISSHVVNEDLVIQPAQNYPVAPFYHTPVIAGSHTDFAPLNKKSVIDIINDSLSVVLYGSQGTGKTTLLCHLIDSRKNQDCCVVDPHGYDDKYPCRCVGSGRNYEEINKFFEFALSEMNKRYHEYKGQDFNILNIFIDEYTLLNKNCSNTKAFIESGLTEFRKIGFRIVLCLHSKRAKYLGLEGSMDMAEGILFVDLKNENGIRWAEIDGQKYSLPGIYTGTKKTENSGVKCKSVSGVLPMPDYTETEIKILKEAISGQKTSRIAESVFGCKGGNQVKKIREFLGGIGL